MKDLIYKIGGRLDYCTNSWKVDTNPIGVEFLMNGKLYLSKEKLPSFADKKEGLESEYYQKMYNVEIIEDFHKFFFLKVNEKVGEYRKSWRETDIIIYPTKNDIGYTEDNPLIKSNSYECQKFRTIMYRTYSYNFYWNETLSGINLSEYKTIAFIGDDYYDKYIGENKYWEGVRKHEGNYDPLVRHTFQYMINNRKAAVRELRLKQLLD